MAGKFGVTRTRCVREAMAMTATTARTAVLMLGVAGSLLSGCTSGSVQSTATSASRLESPSFVPASPASDTPSVASPSSVLGQQSLGQQTTGPPDALSTASPTSAPLTASPAPSAAHPAPNTVTSTSVPTTPSPGPGTASPTFDAPRTVSPTSAAGQPTPPGTVSGCPKPSAFANSSAPGTGKTVALTFDDGPGPSGPSLN